MSEQNDLCGDYRLMDYLNHEVDSNLWKFRWTDTVDWMQWDKPEFIELPDTTG